MRVAFIVNPTAAHGRVGRRIEPLRQAVRTILGDQAEFHVTVGPGHATDLARHLADREAVVAVGGDGTVHEVALGLLDAGGTAALGILPVGTGNDLAHALGYPSRVEDGLHAIRGAGRSAMDCGMAVLDANTAAPIPFFNNVGIGFDALASLNATRYKALPGPLAYVVGVIRALATWNGPQARVEVDGVVHDTPLMFATVGNGTRSGGLFRLTPTASPFDGLLDVCTVRFVPPGRALLVAPRTVNGSHGRLEEVRLRTGSRVRIDCAAGVPVHADGEIVATACRRLDAWIVAGALPVLVPGPGHHTRSARSRRRVI